MKKSIILYMVLFMMFAVLQAQEPEWNRVTQAGVSGVDEGIVQLYSNKMNTRFDSLNVRFVGNWPFGTSYTVTTDSTRQLAFCGSGGGVYILDVSTPAAPIMLSEKVRTRGIVWGLVYDEPTHRLYIAAGPAGLEIWDVTDPSNPLKLGYYDTPDFARGVTVIGSYAYVADELTGIIVIDISTPSAPSEVGFCDTPGLAFKVAVSGSYAYVADTNTGMRVIDISTPSAPFEVGYCIGFAPALDVEVSGSYAYVGTQGTGMRVIDISTPSAPSEVGFCAGFAPAIDVELSGSYAYVATEGTGMRVIDISEPSSPSEVGSYFPSVPTAYCVAVTGSYAYVAEGCMGLRLIDISIPSSPSEVGSYVTPEVADEVVVAGSYAYVTETNCGLWVIDISTPSAPSEVGYCITPQAANGVAIDDSYAYVTCGNAGLRVIDISTPSAPSEVGYYDTPGYAMRVEVAGSYAYVADHAAGLRVIDISTPSAPSEVGYCETPSLALGVEVAGSYAYVADYTAGLRVIDISTPSAPSEVGYCETPGEAVSVAVTDLFAYVADRDGGLRVIDISEPSSPSEVGYCETPGTFANSVALDGSYAYVTDAWGGLRMIDISEPSSPSEVGYYVTPGRARDVEVVGQCAYIANEVAGLQIYEILLTGVTGDFSSDGYVDVADLQLLGDHWHFVNTDPGWNALYDLVPDNIIDVADLQVFGDNWHEGTPPTRSGREGRGLNENAGLVFDLDSTTPGNQNLTNIPSQPVGNQIRIDAYCTDVVNLDTYEFEIIYNPTVLEYITSTHTNPITYDPNILTNNGGEALGWMIDTSVPGVLSIAYTLAGIDTLEAPEGEGLIADIVFQVLSTIEDSLTFEDVYFYDSFCIMDIITDVGIAIIPGSVSAYNNEFDSIFKEIKLENYPNPFNPETTISFSVTQTSPFVTLEVFDLKGQKVKTLINERLEEGDHQVVWDGKDENSKSVSSGIYFYKMNTGNYEKIKRMVLLK